MHLIHNSISMMTNMTRLFALTIILLFMMAQQGLAADNIALSLVLDHSGSMDTNDPDDIRISSAKLCADLMESGSDWGAAVGFDDSADVQIVMTRDMSALKNGRTGEVLYVPRKLLVRLTNYVKDNYTGEVLRLMAQSKGGEYSPSLIATVVV